MYLECNYFLIYKKFRLSVLLEKEVMYFFGKNLLEIYYFSF